MNKPTENKVVTELNITAQAQTAIATRQLAMLSATALDTNNVVINSTIPLGISTLHAATMPHALDELLPNPEIKYLTTTNNRQCNMQMMGRLRGLQR